MATAMAVDTQAKHDITHNRGFQPADAGLCESGCAGPGDAVSESVITSSTPLVGESGSPDSPPVPSYDDDATEAQGNQCRKTDDDCGGGGLLYERGY
ncbi:hypothetical protein NQ034_13275 [Brevibacterium sp. 68QC2CO]|nr:hypothetical protein [Brevibacterium sp. 50QC2O2]MCQ9386508.1 hypothetical protein [Brevibacterium sp. 68QC2CO]